jgi:hypothetical protein
MRSAISFSVAASSSFAPASFTALGPQQSIADEYGLRKTSWRLRFGNATRCLLPAPLQPATGAEVHRQPEAFFYIIAVRAQGASTGFPELVAGG